VQKNTLTVAPVLWKSHTCPVGNSLNRSHSRPSFRGDPYLQSSNAITGVCIGTQCADSVQVDEMPPLFLPRSNSHLPSPLFPLPPSMWTRTSVCVNVWVLQCLSVT
jgi:hypothetical protein